MLLSSKRPQRPWRHSPGKTQAGLDLALSLPQQQREACVCGQAGEWAQQTSTEPVLSRHLLRKLGSQPASHHHHPSQLWSRPQQGQTCMPTCGFACWVGTGDLEPGMTAGSQGQPEAKKWESRDARGPALGGRWLVWLDREVGNPLACPE